MRPLSDYWSIFLLELAVKYLRIYLAGMPVILLYNFEAAIFRSCGNTQLFAALMRTELAIRIILRKLRVYGDVSFAQESLSGYLRGFGVSFIPAVCPVIGICGVRIIPRIHSARVLSF